MTRTTHGALYTALALTVTLGALSGCGQDEQAAQTPSQTAAPAQGSTTAVSTPAATAQTAQPRAGGPQADIRFESPSDLDALDTNRYGQYSVVGGALRVDTRGSSAMARLLIRDLTFADGTITVKSRFISGDERAAFGIEFRGAQGASGLSNYRFDTNSNVSYHVSKTVDDRKTSLTEWGWIPRERRLEQNTLNVECMGSGLTFSMNGVQVAQISDATRSEGWVGLYVNPGMVVEFDDLRVESGRGTAPQLP